MAKKKLVDKKIDFREMKFTETFKLKPSVAIGIYRFGLGAGLPIDGPGVAEKTFYTTLHHCGLCGRFHVSQKCYRNLNEESEEPSRIEPYGRDCRRSLNMTNHERIELTSEELIQVGILGNTNKDEIRRDRYIEHKFNKTPRKYWSFKDPEEVTAIKEATFLMRFHEPLNVHDLFGGSCYNKTGYEVYQRILQICRDPSNPDLRDYVMDRISYCKDLRIGIK